MRSRLLSAVLLLTLSSVAVSVRATAQDSAKARVVTFNRDVLPILQKNCQICHRPGEIAPMSFLTYDSTRPWAKAIKLAVATASWVDAGAPEGDPKRSASAGRMEIWLEYPPR